MGKTVQNEQLSYKVMSCIKEMDYKKGDVLVKRKIYKDVRYLAHQKFIELDDLKSFDTSKSEEESLEQVCQFALEALKKLGYVKKEAYDQYLGIGLGSEKWQYRLLIDTKDLIIKQGVGIITQEGVMKEAQELKKILGV